jgi:HAD domain in Swiss Army Knife RNA repair proteins
MREKPLLLVDVDGVISLFGFPPNERPDGRFELVDGIGHLLSATAGAHLLDLAQRYDLVWCSGWEEKANDYLPHALGLPGPLPYLAFDHKPAGGRPHWKLPAIDAYAGPTRPTAWIDDAHDAESRKWAANRAGPTLLVDTEPATGITAAHVRRLTRWAEELG